MTTTVVPKLPLLTFQRQPAVPRPRPTPPPPKHNLASHARAEEDEIFTYTPDLPRGVLPANAITPSGHRRGSSAFTADGQFSPFSDEQDYFQRAGDTRPTVEPTELKTQAEITHSVTEAPSHEYKTTLLQRLQINASYCGFAAKRASWQTYNVLRKVNHLPEDIVRCYRKFSAPKEVVAPAPGAVAKKDNMAGFFWAYMIFWLLTNIAFVVWVVFVCRSFLNPHYYRHSAIGDTRAHWWNFVGALPIYGGVFIAVDIFGPIFIWVVVIEALKGKGGVFYLTGKRKRLHDLCSNPFVSTVPFLAIALWTLIVPLVAPQMARKAAFNKQCGGWDYSVLLNGRVDAQNITRGRVTVDSNGAQMVWETANYVNITYKENAGTTVLTLISADAAFDPPPLVSNVTYNFPYLETDEELAGYASNGDRKRATLGNYTATLKTGQTYSGSFPYLREQGLRLDELGLIPDYLTSWRSRVVGPGLCQDGPDAYLYENPDTTARFVNGNRSKVLLTGMTKYGACCQSKVCANRRKQPLSNTPWADGEEGLALLDQMLIVPLGLLLVEQIKWGSCCGDGWTAF